MKELYSIEARIEEDILTRMSKMLYDYQYKYYERPIAMALGPQEFINWREAGMATHRMIYDPVDGCEFEGVQIYIAPINGIILLGNHKSIYQMIEIKRGLLEGLN